MWWAAEGSSGLVVGADGVGVSNLDEARQGSSRPEGGNFLR